MESTPTIISRDKVAKGMKVFLFFTLAGMVIILYGSSLTESIQSLRNFRLSYLALIVLLVLFDWTVAAARIYIFASHIHPPVSFRGSVKANMVNIFMGGVTPSQTGGGVGQIYVLYREGMSVLDAAVASFLSFANTVIFLPLCGILVFCLIRPEFDSVLLGSLSTASIVLFGLIMLAVILALISPVHFESALRSGLGLIPFLKNRLEQSRWVAGFFSAVHRYHALMSFFLRKGRRYLAAGFLLTGVIYFNKFIIAYLVIRGLGIEPDFWTVIYLQLILILVFYFSPTPGSSGLAEISTAVIMGKVLPVGQVAVFTLIWRFFTLYGGMICGAAVLLTLLIKPGEKKPIVGQ
ncbi:MAG: flippase-like domain-containing protein [Candidatus Krumholzibacteriota bacterium]|nr:flippase-like domain-containing protein [Candidatus Krumholzibacteriota bacterium]